MKISKKRLQKIIKEERTKILREQYKMDEFTPEQQAVADACEVLEDALYKMGAATSDELTEYYLNMLRAMQKSGVKLNNVMMMI